MAKYKVLLADDEEVIRKLVALTLGDDYDIYYASDGEEAVQVARREHPDLMFLDVMMPKLDGFEVCRLLKSDPATAETIIIMLSARGQDGDKRLGQEAGADHYFVKPFSPLTLLNKVNEVLSSS